MGEPLRFEELRIRRMPGFEDEGFPLLALSPGINVIHGPNGSGKTTTAHAIEALLWPRSATGLGPSVSGRFLLAGAEWSVDLEVDRAVHQRNGMVADPPLLPPAEERDRYRLSLHELLEAEDSRFARVIQREASGGYDLAAARTELPAAGSGSRRFGEVRALNRASDELDEAIRGQRELHERERELAGLRTQQESAAAAGRNVETLRLAITHAAARDAEVRARDSLALHPPQMAQMRGDEQERLTETQAEIAALDGAIAAAEQKMRAADEVVASSVSPDVDGGLIAGLRAELEALREAEREIAAAERVLDGATAKLAVERRGIGGLVREELLGEIDPHATAGLVEFARRAAHAHARLRATEAQIAALGEPGLAPDPARVARLEDGMRILRAWLRCGDVAEDADRKARALSIAAGAALVLGGLALWSVTPAALALSAVGAAVLFIALSIRRTATDGRIVHRSEYERLELDRPGAWEPAAVERLLAELEELRAAAAADVRRVDARRALEPELARAEEVVRRVVEERLALAERLGVEPALDEAALVTLMERISRWQAARADLLEAEGALARARGQADTRGRAIAERLAPFAGETPHRLADLTAAVQRLEESRQRRDEALRDRRGAEESRDENVERRNRCREALRALYERAGVSDGDVDGLLQRCEAYAAYRGAKQHLDEREVATREARDRLVERGAGDDVLHLPRAELEEALSAAEVEASRLAELDSRINATETRVLDAKKLHDIEGRLAELDRLKDDLREVREREARGAVAELLVDHVRREAREEQLPAVFVGARTLFSRITRGRYTLELTDGPDPEFHAIDNLTRRGRSLEQLSSGTRVQLLLAVRVAFVESLEAEARLPLVLDEVLGNSDDERASAIIDAVVELAADGRQIFYFTAQSDEIHKWGATLEARGSVPWRAIDLVDATRTARTIRIQELQVATPRATRVPAPEGRSPAAYAEALAVPAVDPAVAHAGSLHLWYLIPDPQALYDVLRKGPECWGELEGLARSAGMTLVDPDVHARAAALARAADAWFEAVRIGAGRPVERSVLLEEAGISDTFRDPVDEIRQRVGGDARQLLGAIENGQLKGFRRNKLELLREYLTAEGYVDVRDPLSDSEVRSRVIGTVAGDLERELLSLADVDALINRLAAGATS